MRLQDPRTVRRCTNTSGQALVEFTLVLPLLLMLFFGILEFGLYFYTRVSLRHVVRESARFAVTGNVLSDSAGKPMSKAQSIEQLILTGAPSIQLTPSNITLTPADGGGTGPGGPYRRQLRLHGEAAALRADLSEGPSHDQRRDGDEE
jgi:Flp pilus assembly protein TadG